MNIDKKGIIKKAYDGVTIRTDLGKDLHVCLRDWGFDMKIDNGEWFHVDTEDDICCLKCKRKMKLEKINNRN